jgi:hypothetical protein
MALFAWIFLVVLMSGCGGTNPTSTTIGGSPVALDSGGIQGTVSASGTPFPGAFVETADRQTQTGSGGAYLLYPLPAGNYRVTARSPGLDPAVKENIRVNAGAITENIGFALSSAVASVAKNFEVLSIVPFYGTDGDELTVLAKGIGTTPGKVMIGTKEAFIMEWNIANDGQIRIRLPAEIETGDVKIILNGQSSQESPPVRFIARPVALEARPGFAKPGSMISLIGRNFFPIVNFNRVSINGLACEVLADSTTTKLNILLPNNAQTGVYQIKVVTDQFQLDGISSATLTIPPELIFLSPQRSIPGITLSLYGNNFGANKSFVQVFLGDKKVITGDEILTFSDKKLTIAAPPTSVVPAGTAIDISVGIGTQRTASFTWGSYDATQANLVNYGVYDLTAISPARTLKLARLAPKERLAFLSVLAANNNAALDGTYFYNVTALLGSNTTAVPSIARSTTAANRAFSRAFSLPSTFRSVAAGDAPSPGIRWMAEPNPATATFMVKNLAAADPDNSENDQQASATFKATGTYCLVYVDNESTAVLTASDTDQIALNFDILYPKVRNAFGVLNPPEGNVDAQSKIILLLTPKISNGKTSSLKSLAYFNPRDKVSTQANSNGTEILYLYDRAYETEPDNLFGAISAELHRMMYFHQRGTEGVPWLEAGLGLYAQNVASYGFLQNQPFPHEQVLAYLQNPHEVSLNRWPLPRSLTPANFGLSYLFIQYLYERCGGVNSLKRLHTLRNDPNMTGLADINTYQLPLPYGPGLNFVDFFNEFGLSMYCDGKTSTYLPSQYQFRDIQLTGGPSSLSGLRHLGFDDNPVIRKNFAIPGYGVDLLEYAGGNDGDVAFSIQAVPSEGTFKTWVLYYPAE